MHWANLTDRVHAARGVRLQGRPGEAPDFTAGTKIDLDGEMRMNTNGEAYIQA
jgi:hypothetical protein